MKLAVDVSRLIGQLTPADLGDSIEEVERLIREAIPLHIESLRAHGEPVPPPTTVATTIIPAPAALTSTASDPQA